MVSIEPLDSSSLSLYKTAHHFEKYGQINTLEDFQEYCQWARSNGTKMYILGNGSNTLFVEKNVKSLILKNNLPKLMTPLPNFRLEVSSSMLISNVLKYCYENSLDSFYYLASVPATVGGALAMNAGRNRSAGVTVYDFVESITFFEDGCLKILKNEEIERDYRETPFSGLHKRLIISAIFQFKSIELDDNPLIERRNWSKQHQDNTAPNCGSVFKACNHKLLFFLRGMSVGKASFSTKTNNWIINKSVNSQHILRLIYITKILHSFFLQKIALEIIEVE